MSSILDALKKSDQNRPNGDGQKVNNIRFSDAENPAKSRKGFYLLVIVLLLVAGALWGHQQGWFEPLYQKIQSFTAATPDDDAKPTEVAQKPEQNKPSQTPKQNKKSPALKPPKPTAVKQQVATQKEIKAHKSEPQKIQDLIPEKTKPAEDEAPASLTLESKDNQTKTTPAEPKKQPTKPKQQPKAVTQQSHLLLHQLPFSIRKNMPSLKMNIHMYDPKPENRMVIINGQRFNIGDDIEGVATVQDIVPEGVVIASGDVVFLLPK